MRRASILLVGIVLTSAASLRAQAVVTPADRASLGVTVYQGFGLIRDARRAGSGAEEIVWTVVPASIDPGTAVLRADGRMAEVSRTTIEAEVGPAGLLPTGRPVVLVSPEGERLEAVVASPVGPVFRAGDRLIVEWKGPVEIPDPSGALDPAPRIRWQLARPAGGVLTATYLASGLSWTADYVALLEGEERMALDANVTVANGSGMAYPDATLQLVAGVVRRAGGPPAPLAAREMVAMAAEAPAPEITREALGEVHLYTVEGPVTLSRDATTQLNLFRAPRVPVAQELVLEGPGWYYQGRQDVLPPEHPEVRLRFTNDRAGGLGEPLPAGVVHVYREDSRGALQFVGDGPIPHTPAGEEVRIAIGQAFDVTARRVQTDWRRLDERTEESAWRIELRNGGERPRAVRLVERFAGEWTILEESHPHEKVDARTARWTVTVPAAGSIALTYRVRTAY